MLASTRSEPGDDDVYTTTSAGSSELHSDHTKVSIPPIRGGKSLVRTRARTPLTAAVCARAA